MSQASLTAISPLEGRYHDKVKNCRPIFSEFGLIRFRVQVEIRWLLALNQFAKIPELTGLSPKAQAVLNDIFIHFSEKDAEHVKQIEAGINHDVKAVEYFIKERIAGNAELAKLNEFVHFGCTSEDINNLAYGLMLIAAREEVILPALNELITILQQFSKEYADIPMLAHTHGQPASPTTVGKEMANFTVRLNRQIQHLKNAVIMGKLNGASGNYNALTVSYPNIDWQSVSQQFIEGLGLTWNPYTTQIEPHDYMAEFFSNSESH